MTRLGGNVGNSDAGHGGGRQKAKFDEVCEAIHGLLRYSRLFQFN
tara:strand:- start:2089 stop:2223 length:135 start_codon:yes stop_codon:yes gene_type:complete